MRFGQGFIAAPSRICDNPQATRNICAPGKISRSPLSCHRRIARIAGCKPIYGARPCIPNMDSWPLPSLQSFFPAQFGWSPIRARGRIAHQALADWSRDPVIAAFARLKGCHQITSRRIAISLSITFNLSPYCSFASRRRANVSLGEIMVGLISSSLLQCNGWVLSTICLRASTS